MTFAEYKYLLLSDLYRIEGGIRLSRLLWHVFLGESYKYNFWMRTTLFCRRNAVLRYTLFPVARLVLRHYKYKLGISVPHLTEIGSGFFIGHFVDIVVHAYSRIGRNCNITQGVTLGQGNRGRNKGYPVLGDNVYIGPGAKIVGAVKVGSNVAIGANCVVTKDVPDNAVVAGVPGKVISYGGVTDYVERTDYDRVLLKNESRSAEGRQ